MDVIDKMIFFDTFMFPGFRVRYSDCKANTFLSIQQIIITNIFLFIAILI